MIKLRWYQQEAVDAIFASLDANPLVQLECGLGKSYLFAEIVRRLPEHARILMVLPNKRLVENNAEALRDMGFNDFGIYCAGLNKKEGKARVVIGTINSLYRATTVLQNRSHILVDEAHLMALDDPSSMHSMLKKKAGAQVKWVGATATPWRMDSSRPVELMDCPEMPFRIMAYRTDGIASYKRLLAEQHLAPLVPIKVGFHLDANLRSVNGDYQTSELEAEALAAINEMTRDALPRLAGRKRVMWFCAGVEHAKQQYAKLIEAGEAASLLVGELDSDEQDKQLEAFKKRQTRHIVSVAMVTTGFSVSDIDAIVLARKTKSIVLHRQILGRGVRPAFDQGKQDCAVLDYARNLARCGAINTPIDEIKDSTDDLWTCGDKPINLLWYGELENAPDLYELGENPDYVGCGALNPRSTLVCEACGERRPFVWRYSGVSEAGNNEDREEELDHDDNVAVVTEGEELTIASYPVEHFEATYSPEKDVVAFHIVAGAVNQVLELTLDPRGGGDALRSARARLLWKAATGAEAKRTAYHSWLMQRDEIGRALNVQIAGGIIRRITFDKGTWSYRG